MPVSSLPIAENGEKGFGQAAKRQACTSCLLLDHISRYGSCGSDCWRTPSIFESLFQLATKPPKTPQFEPAPLSPCPQPTEQADREESNCCRHHNIDAVEGRVLKVRASLIEELIPNDQPDDFNHGEEPRLEVCQEPLLHHFYSSFSAWNQNR